MSVVVYMDQSIFEESWLHCIAALAERAAGQQVIRRMRCAMPRARLRSRVRRRVFMSVHGCVCEQCATSKHIESGSWMSWFVVFLMFLKTTGGQTISFFAGVTEYFTTCSSVVVLEYQIAKKQREVSS